MTLPASGSISISQVNTELGEPSTFSQTINWGAYRQLANVARAPGSSYSFSNFFSKTAPGSPFPLYSNGNIGPSPYGEPYGVAVTLNGQWAYVTNVTYTSVDIYSRNTSTGTLTYNSRFSVSSWLGTLGNPTLHPNGNFLAVGGDSGSYGAVVLSVNQSTGALSFVSTLPGYLGFNATFSPNGNSIYFAATKSGYNLYAPFNSSTGAIGSISYLGTGSPSQIAVSPDNNFVYITDYNGGVIYVYNYNLTSQVSYYGASAYPIGLAITPDGNHIYVASTGSNALIHFTRNQSTGQLTNVGTYNTGSYPTYISISPDGFSLYVTSQNSNYLSAYAINVVNGSLNGPTNYGTAYAPVGVTVTPDNNSVYVACYSGPNNSQPGIYGYNR